MTNNVIIVAGGKGLRMGSELPKQFIPINGKPVLMHTIEKFHLFDTSINIIVVLPDSYQHYWKELCKEYSFAIPHSIINGGETRFHSVKNGLTLVKNGTVAVHDGARPFPSTKFIRKIFELAKQYKAIIPTIDETDSLRKVIDKTNSEIIDRSSIKRVQTPQVFESELLKNAYNTEYSETFTDDASVVEKIVGINIFLTEGEITNIKITTPLDLKIAQAIINNDSV